MPVFTQRSSDVMEAIITECKICPPVDFSNGEMPAMVYMSQNAMWDTGATNTLVRWQALCHRQVRCHSRLQR